MPPPRTPRLDLQVQKLAMQSRFPEFCCVKEKEGLTFTGTLAPRETSPAYEVRVQYRLGQYPRVNVLSPTLHPLALHLWDDGSLCLFRPRLRRWRNGDLLAKKILPWTALWLYFYEGWLETGVWLGPEASH